MLRRTGIALFSWAIASCAQAPAAIVVAVRSNLTVPTELASVHVEVGAAACGDASCAHDFALTGAGSVALPFSFTVRPHEGGGPLDLVVRGRDPSGADRVVRSVHTAFAPHQTLRLEVALDRACLDHAACADGETCADGSCAGDAIDPATLAPVVPGMELAFDAGMPDDADVDANVDAFAAPRSCADLPAGSASGAYTIDPDGPGGEAPFEDWCETTADGGGWTLIAKIDPSSGLAYDDATWTALSPVPAAGAADLDVETALLPSYWSLPVSDVRIVMAPAATPTSTRSLVASIGSGTPTLLRRAMDVGQGVHLTGVTADAWAALIGLPSPGAGACELSGVPAELPASAPILRVRIGWIWSEHTDCSAPAMWAGLGASGTASSASCDPITTTAGGGRVCGTGAARREVPLAAWLFAR